MTRKEIEKKLKKEKSQYIREINYQNKSYIKAINFNKKEISYIYYKIEENKIKKVEDKQLLNYFKENYEIKPSPIIYFKG